MHQWMVDALVHLQWSSGPGKAMYVTGDTYEGTFVEGLRTGRVLAGTRWLVSSHTSVICPSEKCS